MDESVDFFQITYKPEQAEKCYPFAKVYLNNSLTEFFENAVIKTLVMASEADKIAVCSWKLRQKMRWNVCRPRELTMEVLKTPFQVMSFTCNTKYHQFLNFADQNHFCATREIYQKYVFEYLSPAMILMNGPELRELCWRDSNYSNLNKTDSATADYLKEKIGVPYYPYHAFVLERLFAIFCHNRKIKVDYL
jgi:hypothetical protein